MPTSCSQQYNLKVKGPVSPTEYWTLDETGVVDRVGKVQATHLVPDIANGANIFGTGSPALFSNGLDFQYYVTFDGTKMDNIETGFISNLGYPGNGFSMTFWFNIVQLFGGWETAIGMAFGSNLNRFGVGLGFDASNGLDVDSSAADEIILPMPTGVWTFLHVFSQLDGKFGIQINNGAKIYATNPHPFPPDLDGDLSISPAFTASTDGHVIIDEILLNLSAELTPAQVTYLWNAGNGRTWPL